MYRFRGELLITGVAEEEEHHLGKKDRPDLTFPYLGCLVKIPKTLASVSFPSSTTLVILGFVPLSHVFPTFWGVFFVCVLSYLCLPLSSSQHNFKNGIYIEVHTFNTISPQMGRTMNRMRTVLIYERRFTLSTCDGCETRWRSHGEHYAACDVIYTPTYKYSHVSRNCWVSYFWLINCALMQQTCKWF